MSLVGRHDSAWRGKPVVQGAWATSPVLEVQTGRASANGRSLFESVPPGGDLPWHRKPYVASNCAPSSPPAPSRRIG